MASTDGVKALADVGNSVPVPFQRLNMNVSRAFLLKTYDMVDDPATNRIISWGPMNNSFIVKDLTEFTGDLLPKYFKHDKFSSFLRQLNNYGFRRVDTYSLEFANKDFLRGQRHLLSSIVRGKPDPGQNQQPQQPHGQSSTVEACVEVGKSGLEGEVERLERDMNVLMQEFAKLRKQQNTTDTQLQAIVQHLHGMEQRQQQMMSRLSKAVNRPDFLAQAVQKQNENSGLITQGNKKRRRKPDVVTDEHPVTTVDGQIFNNESYMNDGSTAMFSPMMLDASHQLETLSDGTAKTYPELSPLVGSQELSAVNLSSKNMLMHECRLQVAPKGNGDSSGFLHPTTDENIFPDINSWSIDSDVIWDSSMIDELLKPNDPEGGQLPVSSPLATDAAEMDTTPPAAPLRGT